MNQNEPEKPYLFSDFLIAVGSRSHSKTELLSLRVPDITWLQVSDYPYGTDYSKSN